MVDAQTQIILYCAVTNQAADAPHAVPMLAQVVRTIGQPPRVLLADAGYFSEANIRELEAMGSKPLIATEKPHHRQRLPPCPRGRPSAG